MNMCDETYPYLSQWLVEIEKDVEIGWDQETRSLVRAFQFDELIWQSKENIRSLGQALKELEEYIEVIVDPRPEYWGDEYGYEPED